MAPLSSGQHWVYARRLTILVPFAVILVFVFLDDWCEAAQSTSFPCFSIALPKIHPDRLDGVWGRLYTKHFLSCILLWNQWSLAHPKSIFCFCNLPTEQMNQPSNQHARLITPNLKSSSRTHRQHDGIISPITIQCSLSGSY